MIMIIKNIFQVVMFVLMTSFFVGNETPANAEFNCKNGFFSPVSNPTAASVSALMNNNLISAISLLRLTGNFSENFCIKINEKNSIAFTLEEGEKILPGSEVFLYDGIETLTISFGSLNTARCLTAVYTTSTFWPVSDKWVENKPQICSNSLVGKTKSTFKFGIHLFRRSTNNTEIFQKKTVFCSFRFGGKIYSFIFTFRNYEKTLVDGTPNEPVPVISDIILIFLIDKEGKEIQLENNSSIFLSPERYKFNKNEIGKEFQSPGLRLVVPIGGFSLVSWKNSSYYKKTDPNGTEWVENYVNNDLTKDGISVLGSVYTDLTVPAIAGLWKDWIMKGSVQMTISFGGEDMFFRFIYRNFNE